MMGTKNLGFAPLPRDTSPEDLLPGGSSSRRLEELLDFSFVRDLMASLRATGGRPGVDPVVFVRLRLVMHFEGVRSERELTRLAADRANIRRALGY